MVSRPLVLIPVALFLTAVTAGALWHLGDLREQRGVESITTGEPVSIGGPFALTDQNGNRRTDEDYRGRFMLVFFGYTYCPDVCPTTLAVEAAALDKLGARADKVVPIFITVDPKRDTPETLKSYLAAFGMRFVGLTGDDDAIASAAKAYRVYYQAHTDEGDNYTVDHSGIVYLMGPDGKFVANYSLQTSPDALAADLAKKIAAAH